MKDGGDQAACGMEDPTATPGERPGPAKSSKHRGFSHDGRVDRWRAQVCVQALIQLTASVIRPWSGN